MAHSNILLHGKLLIVFLLFPFMSNAGIVILNGLTHQHDVAPGQTYRGEIEIQNTVDTEQAVRLYQRDYTFNYTGEAFYNEPGSLDRSNSDWIDLSPTYLILKPKEKRLISYEVKTPSDNSLVGTYWSVIMVEGEAPVDTSSLQNGLSIQTQLRYAIQMVTTFNAPGERNLTFFDVNMVNEEGERMLMIDIENKGEFLFRPDVSVELFNENGQSQGVFIASQKRLYPDTSARFFVNVDDIGTGNYQSLLLADCGGEDIFGINIDLEITDD